ncbi:DsbA family oxidoreductase [Ureibacillus manganicus]|uniref:DSBA oxidoreductase n=1 Tax=Ureibacillus manganicus DSM 26584 TaxID=1384049 RepID=A0A0A3HY73_9BACL|nr:DsbA family oxidoreductase [Ureibacillus manganicus]KGR77394.1 DSBA oxidoreductase [Ureibacillus manganicus DSM 26584]
MKITIWSDFVCPFCYIGESHLEEALKKFEHADEVEIEYKSFLLSPESQYTPGKNYYQAFADEKGVPLEQAKAMMGQVLDMAKQSSVSINYDIAKFTNTVDAHHVFQYAKAEGKGNEFFKRFYDAHFNEGEVLSDNETIVRLAKEVGLDEVKVRNIIETKEYSNELTHDLAESRQVGVQGVPFFVFDNKYALSGARPAEYFTQVLEKVWEEKESK